ncbi:NAD(P)-binding protein [Auricularia subglabra TFB-10046 SS5]|uniref:NAD(P)-binding protein n=1 Tax=Auricularia subglabra (strain TFB-10046 / SS5) TaxID=717982 RepID=J0LF37_AURST|nr:NAD(P)-binding protein [Auricularia subglabra TFB-10046 SS5]
MPVWFVTGTSRGIGLELTKQLAANAANTIISTCRSPSTAVKLSELAAQNNNVHVIALDVLSEESIRSAFVATKGIVGPQGIDYLINNAGNARADSVPDVTPEQLELTFKTHVVGMLLVFRTFLPLVEVGKRKVVVNVTSALGSINCGFGEVYASYSIGKAALNMLTYKMAKQYPDLIIFPFQPGHISTDLGGANAPLTVEFAVAKHIPLFESAALETHAGRFLDYEGKELPF